LNLPLGGAVSGPSFLVHPLPKLYVCVCVCVCIRAVGANLTASDDVRVIDARGKLVFPGDHIATAVLVSRNCFNFNFSVISFYRNFNLFVSLLILNFYFNSFQINCVS